MGQYFIFFMWEDIFKMSHKGDIQLLIAVLYLALFAILIFYVVPQLTPIVRFEIRLTNQTIERYSDNVELNYTITNNKNEPLANVTIINYIIGQEYRYKYMDDYKKILSKKEVYSSNLNFSVRDLPGGNYTIKSELSYGYKGNDYKEELTLGFSVI